MPARYAARANWKALEPSIRVLSRSKKAAPRRSPPSTAALGAVDFEDHRVALAATRADGRHTEPAAAPAQLVDERADDARAAGADRMPEGDGAAVHVDLRLVDSQHPHRVQGDRGERLVDLEQVDVVDREARLLERGPRGVRGGAREVGEVVGHSGLRDDPRERR